MLIVMGSPADPTGALHFLMIIYIMRVTHALHLHIPPHGPATNASVIILSPSGVGKTKHSQTIACALGKTATVAGEVALRVVNDGYLLKYRCCSNKLD